MFFLKLAFCRENKTISVNYILLLAKKAANLPMIEPIVYEHV